jgi:hypothetical protein
MITLNATQLTSLLAETIPAKIPVLVQGAPGIGKSDVLTQAAADADADLILSHPAVSDPTDVKGLPWIVKGKHGDSAMFLPFGELERAISAKKTTVWFLDDLGQASPAVQASYMQLLLARQVNGHAISDHIVFVAATNRRTDRAGVSGILEPVKSRFGTIVELEPDLDSWCNWAIDHNVNPLLIAFLRFKPDLLCKFSATNDLSNSPVPRTWSHVNRLLTLSLTPTVQNVAIAGAVGEGAATEFAAFQKLWAQLPNIDQILIDPSSVPVPKNPAVLYSLAAALATKATPQNFARIASYVNKMVDAGSAEFGVLCVRDCLRRDNSLTQSSAFVKLATGELGRLISGKD